MILVISDYHRHENDVLRMIDRHCPDVILCAGDGESNDEFYVENKIKSVAGNCDFARLPNVRIEEVGHYRILLTHGHLYNVIFGIDRLYYLAKENNMFNITNLKVLTHEEYVNYWESFIEDYFNM